MHKKMNKITKRECYFFHDCSFNISEISYDSELKKVQFHVYDDENALIHNDNLDLAASSSFQVTIENVEQLVLDDIARIETHSLNYFERISNYIEFVGSTDFKFQVFGDPLIFRVEFWM